MILDHVGQSFFPNEILFRFFGFFAFPLFALRVCDGYKYTSNFWNYIKRIFIIGLISQPLQIWVYNLWTLNVFFTLMFGLLLIKFIETYKSDKLFIVVFTTLTIFISFVYDFFIFNAWGLLTILCLYYLRENLIKFTIGYSIINGITYTFQYLKYGGFEDKTLLIILFPLIINLNQIKVNFRFFNYKYWHYFIFPGHLFIIGVILMLI